MLYPLWQWEPHGGGYSDPEVKGRELKPYKRPRLGVFDGWFYPGGAARFLVPTL